MPMDNPRLDDSRSHALFTQAQALMPGGVNSPVRAFKSVGGEPFFAQRAEGAYLVDVDGNRYIDYVGSWGPMIVGHNHPKVLEAVIATARDGLSFGVPNPMEVTMAQRLSQLIPGCEMVRMVNSGTEATLSAIRLARGATGRARIVKFEGCYHGHGDSLLVKAGSGALTFGHPSSAGVPEAIANETRVLPYNDIAALDALFASEGDAIAGVIVEPVAGNMNLVRPAPGFLEAIRVRCDAHGAVLIFDEVMTGFRVHAGGVQGMTGIAPDLTTLGKVIGGGMPVAAFGGKRAIMEEIAPLGPVYQAGTLSGNPVALAAGLATLAITERPGFYESLAAKASALCRGLEAAARRAGVDFVADSVGGMFGLYFAPRVPASFAEVMSTDKDRFNRFFHAMLDAGIYFAPSAYEAGFVSAAHDDATLDATLAAARAAFAAVA